VTLTLGGNYTRDRKDVSSATTSTDAFAAVDLAGFGAAGAALRPYQFFPPFLNLPNAVESGRTRDGKFTWNARIAVDLADSVNAYLSYATGFKASSFNLSRDSRPLAADIPALTLAGLATPNLIAGSRFAAPESAKVWELGVKANWQVATANVTLFKQSIDGFQSNIFTGTGFALANAGRQSTFGIEFEGQVRPTPSLSFGASFVYLDPEYDRFPNSPLGDASGRRPAGVPALSANLGAQWNRKLASGDRIVLRTDYHYEAPVQAVEGLPGFILRDSSGAVISYQPALDAARPYRREIDELSASLTYAHRSGIELTLWGRNLLDDRHILTVFDSVAQAGSVSGYLNQPRTYGLTGRFRW
jgi:outer membrane receptor protein involved in Fe transport